MLGRVIEQYRVDALLGESRDAAVYRALHRSLGSTHALKIPWLRSRESREALFQEGRIRSRVRHRNLVGVTAVLDQEMPALVLEYVAGPSLSEWLSSKTPSLGMALRLFRGIVEGVAAAGQAGLMFPELSTSTVHLAPDDDGFVPKLGLFEPPRERTNYPDRHRAELQALGAILYELVTGRPLLMLAGSNGLSRRVEADVPPRIADLLRRMMGNAPTERIQSCSELLSLLDRLEPPHPWRVEWGGPSTELAPYRAPQQTVQVLPALAALSGVLAGTLVGLGMLEQAFQDQLPCAPLAHDEIVVQSEPPQYEYPR
jgi:serine/threonine protein kinase